MKGALAAGLLACVLTGCTEPVFVPEAGPGAPGYSERSTPAPPDIEVVHAAATGKPLPDGGFIDRVTRGKGVFAITGWALVDPDAPRGVLKIVLPTGVDAHVRDVEVLPRPDVVTATGNAALAWAGFTISVRGALPANAGVCVISRSTQGAFRLGGSDDALCPT